jgi:predicted GIY-YIG superfamily endonuclease
MVYLIHFDKAYRHAQHYIGFTDNLEQRMHDHELGTKGSKLLKAVRDVGINFKVVRTWPDGDRTFERKLHNYKKSSHLCPVCQAERKKLHELPILSKQSKTKNPMPAGICCALDIV